MTTSNLMIHWKNIQDSVNIKLYPWLRFIIATDTKQKQRKTKIPWVESRKKDPGFQVHLYPGPHRTFFLSRSRLQEYVQNAFAHRSPFKSKNLGIYGGEVTWAHLFIIPAQQQKIRTHNNQRKCTYIINLATCAQQA